MEVPPFSEACSRKNPRIRLWLLVWESYPVCLSLFLFIPEG